MIHETAIPSGCAFAGIEITLRKGGINAWYPVGARCAVAAARLAISFSTGAAAGDCRIGGLWVFTVESVIGLDLFVDLLDVALKFGGSSAILDAVKGNDDDRGQDANYYDYNE